MKFQTKQKGKSYSDSLEINYLRGTIKISLTKKIPYKIPHHARDNRSRSNVAMKSDAFGVVGKKGEENRESK